MDLPAELTLQIVHLLHEHAFGPRPLTQEWFLLPTYHPATWEQARAELASAPKPLIVAPLLEPGHLGFWHPSTVSSELSARLIPQFENQVSYHTRKLASLGLDSRDSLRLTGTSTSFTLPVAAFLQWCQEYAFNAGVTIGRTADHGIGQLLLRPPDGGGPPLGGWDHVIQDHDHSH